MRITQVITTGNFAGTERYAVQVGAALAARGHDVRVVGGEPATMRRLAAGAVQWQPGSTAAETARALVLGGRRDLVHSHITKSDFVAAATAPVVRARRVSTRHITAPRGWTRPARALAGPLRQRLDREIAVSEFVSRNLSRPADTVLLNGVPPVEDDGSARGPVVLVAQRLAAEKDTGTALRAFAAARLAAQGWRLVVAGAGEERPALERLAAQLGVAAEFPGWLQDLAAAMRSAGVLLAPAPAEPCGLTVLEAMAHGLPVVAAGSGGTVETLGQEPTAALFPPGDVPAAAAQLRRLVRDDAERRAYGQRLQALQRRALTLDGHVDALERVYLEVVG